MSNTMSAADAGIEPGYIGEFSQRICETAEKMGMRENFVLLVNTSDPYQKLRPPKVKVVGSVSVQRMTDIMCECGCRLNTDGVVYWCSRPSCDFAGMEDTF